MESSALISLKPFVFEIASPFQIGLSKASSMFYSAIDIDHMHAYIPNPYCIPNHTLSYGYDIGNMLHVECVYEHIKYSALLFGCSYLMERPYTVMSVRC